MRMFVALAALGLAAGAVLPVALTPPASAQNTRTNMLTTNAAAESFVRLALEIDTHEAGYVDAYFGPEDWRAAAKAKPRSVVQLKMDAELLLAETNSIKPKDAAEAQRLKVLAANIASARFRLDMIGGARAPFVEEATRLFALKPELKPLSHYDPILARIEALVPGPGPLSARVDAYRSRFAIPADKLKAVMDAAIAECRRRTRARIELPDNESFEMELVKGKSWSAYNYYKGDNRSLIQVNTDLPVLVDRALLLGCHEGYPGHHVQGIFNEKQYRQKGWVEYSVAPLYAPASPLNEGGADFAVDLAFPDKDRSEFDAKVIYPLAGLDPKEAPKYEALLTAIKEIGGARLTIAQMFLDQKISRDEALDLIQKYQLVSRERAEQSLSFTSEYRSYVINYGLGEILVRDYVHRTAKDEAGRWAAYLKTMAEPTLPSDLAP